LINSSPGRTYLEKVGMVQGFVFFVGMPRRTYTTCSFTVLLPRTSGSIYCITSPSLSSGQVLLYLIAFTPGSLLQAAPPSLAYKFAGTFGLSGTGRSLRMFLLLSGRYALELKPLFIGRSLQPRLIYTKRIDFHLPAGHTVAFLMEQHSLPDFVVELEASLNHTRRGLQNGLFVVEGVRTLKQSFLAYGLLFGWLLFGHSTT
jgi:hypothetical protein